MVTTFAARISPRLRTRLLLFLVIALGISGFIVRDVWRGDLMWYLAALAILIGVAIGYLFGRVRSVRWHEGNQHVVSEMDIMGGIAIVLYIVLDLSRDWIFGHWLSGVALADFTLAILGGALFGRFVGMMVSIRKAIPEKSKVHRKRM